ncbi:MAG: hypothetical protein ACO22Q_10080, partial [Burkholderiales bacterium]
GQSLRSLCAWLSILSVSCVNGMAMKSAPRTSRKRSAPAESPAGNQDVFDHAPASRGAQHYTELLEELVVAGFMHAARTKTRPVTRNVPPGARTALTSEQQSAVQSQVAAGLKLVHALQTGS